MLITGLIGAGVDVSTGAMLDLAPNPWRVVPEAFAAPVARAAVALTVDPAGPAAPAAAPSAAPAAAPAPEAPKTPG